jgi:hypothetical protein
MMNTVLLTGAGFSANWGGRLAREVNTAVARRVGDDANLAALLHRNPNFEEALAELQNAAAISTPGAKEQLQRLEAGIVDVFDNMNRHLSAAPFSFRAETGWTIPEFLVLFDAIFTLNQDLLFESHYLMPAGTGGLSLAPGTRWDIGVLPGVDAIPDPNVFGGYNVLRIHWRPAASPRSTVIRPRHQPFVMRLEQNRGETVEDINAQITRFENAARIYQEESTKLRTEIAKTSGFLTASEGDGVDEALDTVRAEQSRLRAEVQNYEQEVAVLELLRETLRSAETEAKARYLSPVITRVEPYLKMLLPTTDLVLDEDLHITGVRRNGLEEEFAKLSEGTQEQIAVLTRLGFAELLLDQGRPATVILDDALVFSDDDRIERMFDIMTRAADRMQIIILTCRKRLFTRLGARMLRIESDDVTIAA